jgi:predicted RNA binding protein YcfA (HicA-like mRNA interferase family)
LQIVASTSKTLYGLRRNDRGSHRQFKHSHKLGRVTVPGKPSDDLAPGTLNSILKQAGLK